MAALNQEFVRQGVNLSGSSFDSRLNSDFQLPAGNFMPSLFTRTSNNPDYAMQIVLPRTNTGGSPEMSANSAYSRWHPGLFKSLPIVVEKGSAPFRYRKVSGPAWLTVTPDTGRIEGTPQLGDDGTFVFEVEDQEGTLLSVTVDITISTANFIFMDAVNGNDANDGSLASPFQTWDGWYSQGVGSNVRDRSAFSGFQLYYRTGTYNFEGMTPDSLENGNDTADRIPLRGGNKPVVHLAYPGETPVLDGENSENPSGNNKTRIAIYQDSGDVCFQGITFRNINRQLFTIEGSPRFLFDRMVFEMGATGIPGVNGQNPSAIFVADGANYDYGAVTESTFRGFRGHSLVEWYAVEHFVAERNIIEDYADSAQASGWGFYAKINTQHFDIKFNTALDITSRFCRSDLYTIGLPTGNCAVQYNNLRAGAGSNGLIMVGFDGVNDTNPPTWIFRNTFNYAAGVPVVLQNGRSAHETFMDNNVVIHDGTESLPLAPNGVQDGVDFNNYNGTLTRVNDFETTDSSVVDSANLLTGASRDTYLGTHGHEVSAA